MKAAELLERLQRTRKRVRRLVAAEALARLLFAVPLVVLGLILLDRVAPEALGGTAKRYFTDVSYVYELTAPMVTVVDMSERDRTDQISAPVRPVR